MTIIAAVDFSGASRAAARAAARLARKLGDDLLVVRSVEPPVALYPELALAGLEAVDTALRAANTNALEDLRGNLAGEGVEVRARLLVGRPDEAIAACAREIGARLVVMGTHGRRGPARLLVGSVAQRTILEAPCPVLAMREGAAPFDAWAAGERPLRVVVGVDRGPATEAALAFVAGLRKAGVCDVVLVHEYWPPAEYARLGLHGPRDLFEPDPEVIAVLRRDLGAWIGELPGAGAVDLRVRPAWGRIGEALAIEAQAERADLLVVGTRQPHGWDRLKLGSSAASTVAASATPVLAVPAPAEQRHQAAAIPVLRSVLVATDLSELGDAAVPQGYALLRGGGVVELCHVHERPMAAPAYALPPDGAALEPARRRELEAHLARLVPPGAAALGITTHVTVVDGGDPAEQILAAARRLGVDAIVVGSHGRSGLRRALVGSVAEGVLRGAERPVHVVRGRS